MTRDSPTLELFNDAVDGIDIDFVHTPTDYMTKLLTQIAGGDYPDIIFLGNGNIEPFVARGQLLPLDDFIARDNFDTADISQQNLKLYNVDGVQYGFPADAPNQQLFYNKTIFDEAGVEVPSSDWEDEGWNWDAFLDKAKAVTGQRKRRLGLAGEDGLPRLVDLGHGQWRHVFQRSGYGMCP